VSWLQIKLQKKMPGIPFKSGADWTGNAAGRPKGSRNKLSEEFIAALCEDFELHGEAVIDTVRRTRPADYLRIVAALVPKEFSVAGGSLEDLSDEELAQAISDLRILAASAKRAVKK
jgi:hypothetical protein